MALIRGVVSTYVSKRPSIHQKHKPSCRFRRRFCALRVRPADDPASFWLRPDLRWLSAPLGTERRWRGSPLNLAGVPGCIAWRPAYHLLFSIFGLSFFTLPTARLALY